jgi:hypothetical protein
MEKAKKKQSHGGPKPPSTSQTGYTLAPVCKSWARGQTSQAAAIFFSARVPLDGLRPVRTRGPLTTVARLLFAADWMESWLASCSGRLAICGAAPARRPVLTEVAAARDEPGSWESWGVRLFACAMYHPRCMAIGDSVIMLTSGGAHGLPFGEPGSWEM